MPSLLNQQVLLLIVGEGCGKNKHEVFNMNESKHYNKVKGQSCAVNVEFVCIADLGT